MSGWSLALTLSLAVWPASGQLPTSGPLSDSDSQAMRAEIARLDALLISAPDKAVINYQMARTWAAGKQWPEAMRWLRKVADQNAGLDPSRDSIFAELRGTREFEGILAAVQRATPAVSHSNASFNVSEGDLVPESVAYDPKGKHFYFGSMKNGKVVRCSTSGNCTDFASGFGTVLGLKVHGNGLWLVSNSDNESAVFLAIFERRAWFTSTPSPGLATILMI